MICVLRSIDRETMAEALRSLGFTVNETDSPEGFCGQCSTPALYTTTGVSVSLMLNDYQTAMLPRIIDPPDMLLDYRSDEEGSEWPMYTCTNGTDSWTQAAGGFA
jgi:hypothetical protein